MDFLIEEGHIIEVFGDYWHGNRQVFAEMNETQQKQIKKDRSRLAYLKRCGRKVLVVWEFDLKNNKEEVMVTVRNFLQEGKNHEAQ